MEIKQPELDPRLVGEAIAMQLERRINHRRAIRRALERTMQAGALGIKVQVKGRLNGAEIARREWNREARVPLHTFSADIDYGLTEAHTTMGQIGIKVWIFKKQFFAKSTKELREQAQAAVAQSEKLAATDEKQQPQSTVAAAVAAKPAPTKRKSGGAMPELPASALAQLSGKPEEEKPQPENPEPKQPAGSEEGEGKEGRE